MNDGRNPWRRWIDTGLKSPDDIVPWESARSISEPTYRAAERSVVMLIGDSSTG